MPLGGQAYCYCVTASCLFFYRPLLQLQVLFISAKVSLACETQIMPHGDLEWLMLSYCWLYDSTQQLSTLLGGHQG